MPLLDHFHPPLFPRHHWESFHVTWAGEMAAALNQTLLPVGYFAEEHAHAGARVEIDVATFRADPPNGDAVGGGVLTQPAVYAPPAPVVVVPAAFPDEYEVRVYETESGARLVAAIELVSPGNKDRAEHRRAFVSKCAGYLAQGVALVVIDVVTNRSANLHAELMAVLGGPTGLPDGASLYCTAYRPIVRDEREQIEVWADELAVGRSMPTMPLALNAERCVPVDLEATYTAARGRKRLT